MVSCYRHTHIDHTKKRVEDVYNTQSENKQTQKHIQHILTLY